MTRPMARDQPAKAGNRLALTPHLQPQRKSPSAKHKFTKSPIEPECRPPPQAISMNREAAVIA